MIFLPVQILVQSDFPLHLKIKKMFDKKKGFFTISIFNLKLLWYFCFRCFFLCIPENVHILKAFAHELKN